MPQKVHFQLDLLAKEMEILGPIRRNWKNFGMLKKGAKVPEQAFHCHIKKGRPTYVVCWKVICKTKRVIEIYYVGTHEKAPY